MYPSISPDQELGRALAFLADKAHQKSQHLEPNQLEYGRWVEGLFGTLGHFLETLPEKKAYNAPDPALLGAWIEGSHRLQDPVLIFQHLVRGLSDQGLLTAGSRHLGYIPGGGLPVAALADWLAATVNPFCGDALASPVAAWIHQECLSTLQTWVGFDPARAGGDLTSGGSHATLLALKKARDRRGLRGKDYHRSVVYVGEHTHHCARKSLEVLFGDEIIIRIVPSNTRHQMEPEALRILVEKDRQNQLNPFLLIATAGSTNLGSVDPLHELGTIAHESSMWFHVDGAYGGFFVLCPNTGEIFRGLERADSVVLDPHKGLFLPYGLGAVLFKEACEPLKTPAAAHADYLQDRFDLHGRAGAQGDPWVQIPPSPMDQSFELTRPFRSLRLWLALKLYGRETFGAALEEKLILAQYARLKLNALDGIEVIHAGDLSVVAFRVRESSVKKTPLKDTEDGFADAHPTETGAANTTGNQSTRGEDATERLLRSLLAEGNVFLTSTMVGQKKVLRLAILSFRTHLRDIDLTLDQIEKQLRLMKGASR